jgi:hypothetical protein
MLHAVDISSIIAEVNQTDNLPVFVSGTSRGAISAIAFEKLFAGISLSAPVTIGSGVPVTSSNFNFDSLVKHAHVSWHANDGCSVSTPAGSENLTSELLSSGVFTTGRAISGGFDNPFEPSSCQARRLHGFFGIESCVVNTTTSWFDQQLETITPSTRPTANAFTTATTSSLSIDLSLLTSGDPSLTYSLPTNNSVLGGSLNIINNEVTYNPIIGVNSTIDSFVYIVTDVNGGSSHNVIKVNL